MGTSTKKAPGSAAANEFARYPYLDVEGRLTAKALYELSKPFDPADLKWLPTDVKKDKNSDEETALALVYADSRVYQERLDHVFGPGNWGSTISFTTSNFFKALPQKMGWGKDKDKVIQEARDVVGFKIFAIVSLQINGLGTKTSTGEEDTSDGNAGTSAEAQAFKRACSMVGIGRYFYDFPRERMPYKWGKLERTPQLPKFAQPMPYCTDTREPILEFTFPAKDGKPAETWAPDKILAASMKLFSVPLCGPALLERRKNTPAKEDKKTAAKAAEPAAQGGQEAAA